MVSACIYKKFYVYRKYEINKGIVQVTIIPIYQVGTRNNPVNYQPAPFTNHFMKIFEIILHKINCGIA